MIHSVKMDPATYRSTLEDLTTRIFVSNDRDYKVGDKIKLAEYNDVFGYTDRESVFEVLAHREIDLGKIGKMISLHLRLIGAMT